MAATIKVKIISEYPTQYWRQLPAGGRWDNCKFIFDKEARDYDWLVVFDLMPAGGEVLACPRANTLLIIPEPLSAMPYPPAYTGQFGTVISPQEPFAVKHPDVIHTQAGLPWFYGIAYGSHDDLQVVSGGKEFDELAAAAPAPKNKVLATVCSQKGGDLPPDDYCKGGIWIFHRHRLDFTKALKRGLPLLDLYGRGFQPIGDKADAIDDYKYHLAIENHPCDNYWTEKIADSYLGYAVPIYHGCPNIGEFFPPESLIHIDIYDYPAALEKISRVVADSGDYARRLPALKEARRRLLYEHNLFALICRTINERGGGGGSGGGVIESYQMSLRGREHGRVRLAKLIPYLQYRWFKVAGRRRYIKKKIAALGDISFTA